LGDDEKTNWRRVKNRKPIPEFVHRCVQVFMMGFVIGYGLDNSIVRETM
jgi:hypothetical protein